ncbi:hypothetical protein [Streptomyces sp. NPDC056821]|uniref:hypothetical protein n=1 Tax=Streptomyces sp. NPDC056821 TaxID=3345952 RepID=UPI0036867F7C
MNVTTPHTSTAVRTFAQQLSSTRRGARLARLLAAAELRAWQVSPSVVEHAEQIVAELSANAALHGPGPGPRLPPGALPGPGGRPATDRGD